MNRQSSARGFTLIELMVVVLIISVLATLGVYSLRAYMRRSKVSEAREIVGQIMSAQEAYFDEVGSYLDVTGGVADEDFYPAGTFNGRTLIQWGGADACSHDSETCAARFARLGITVNSPVRFRYAATTMAVGAAPPVPNTYVSSNLFNPSNVTAPRPGYSIVALSDLTGGGTDRTAVVGTSLQAQLYIEEQPD